MTRLLLIGECPFVNSSAGKLVQNMVIGFTREGYEVTVLCEGVDTTPYMWGMTYNPRQSCEGKICDYIPDITMKIRPLLSVNYELERAREKEKPYDIILAYGYPHSPPLDKVFEEITNNKNTIKTPAIAYIIEESLSIPPSYTKNLDGFNALIYPANTIRQTYLKARPELKEKSYTAPHGVNDEIYNPETIHHICDRKQETYTYTMIAKNMIRKDAHTMLKAFIKNAVKNKEITLGLFLINHMASEGWDIENEITKIFTEENTPIEKREQITNRINILTEAMRDRGLTEQELLELYNNTIIFTFPTTGEGFGLPLVEAGLLEKPLIMTGLPTLKEIWSGYPEKYFIKCTPIAYPTGHTLCHPDPQDLTEKLTKILNEKEKLGEKAREIAKKYTIKEMTKAFNKIINKYI